MTTLQERENQTTYPRRWTSGRKSIYWPVTSTVFSSGIALMWGAEKVPFASLKVLMTSIAVVASTSIAYRFLYDFIVRPVEQESLLNSIRDTVQAVVAGRRVRAYIHLDEIDRFEVRLGLAEASLTCCGPTLINVSRKITQIAEKLARSSKFKVHILILSPGVGNITKALLKANMSEPELEAHLSQAYRLFPGLKQQFPDRVEIYQFLTVPMFSLLGFDIETDNAYVSARHYINGRYPPDCPGLELGSSNDLEKNSLSNIWQESSILSTTP